MEVREPSAKYLVRNRYKQTEVGLIPDDWRPTSIGERAIKIGSGVTPRGGNSNYKEYGRPFVRSQNVGWGNLLLDDLAYIDDETHSTFPATELRIGDVLLNITGASIGRSAMADARLAGGNVNQHVCIIRTELDKVSSRFINYFLLSSLGQRQIDSFQAGGNREGLNFGQIRSIKLALPPTKAEQEAIAEALSDADALIESLAQLLAKKRNIKRGAMQELLTGNKRLPGFSGEWEMKRLGEIAHIKTGARNNQDKIEEGEYPFFVRSATVERINSYSYDCEAILVPGEGGIGSIFHYIQGRFDVHQRVYAITQFSSETSGKFVYFYIAEKFGVHAMQNSVKATVDSLRLPTFRNFEIVMPPTANEQTAIAAILSDMDAEIVALDAKLAKARSLKQGMMQELLTGRIRLV